MQQDNGRMITGRCRGIDLADDAGGRFDPAQQVLIIHSRQYGTVEYEITWP